MSELPVLRWNDVVKALGRAGFRPVRQKGNHIMLEGPGGKFTVVPRHREIAPGTLMKIIAEAGLTKEDFLKLLK